MTVAPEKPATQQPEPPPVPEGHVRLTIDGLAVAAPDQLAELGASA